ncbi:protein DETOXIFICATION 16-like isoform X2 [Euphorbia lathyris]|uniref:protein DETOXIFICATION 16-like isoform X2 n=1 Tax=Euphorbia lathyris TaxID=212925 RepID=UPI0033138000
MEDERLKAPLVKCGTETREKIKKEEIKEEAKKQLKLAGGLVCVNLFMYMIQVISVMFVGHLGELPLSSASIATSFASVTGFSLLKGMGSALDTFCGQSYGAKQYSMVGVHLQRAIVVLLLTSIPLAIIWANAAQILLFLKQDPLISIEAGHYARFMIPSIFGFAIQECLIRFLQTQHNVIPMVLCSGITTLFHILLCWILVFKSGLGAKGAAFSNAISYWINAILLMVYVTKYPSCNKTWTGFSKDALHLHGILSYLRLAIPSSVMLSLEIWSFEMMVLLGGLLPNPQLETSVLSISLNTSAMMYMIPLGLSGAISTRVSNELGAGRPRAARIAVCVASFIVITEGILVGSVLIVGRRLWGYSYSNEERLVNYVAQILVLIAVVHVFDGIQSVLSGTARGCGWQKIGAFINLGAYYLIGIPCSVILAFVYHLGGKGLWTGIIVALVAQAVGLLSKKASDRVFNNIITPQDSLP